MVFYGLLDHDTGLICSGEADAKQYKGWPVTIDQADNYGPEPYGWLPQLNISGMEDPVIKVFKDLEAEKEAGGNFIDVTF